MKLLDASAWTGGQYSLVRAALGLYLLVHFAMLVPWGPEVFSSAGVLPDASESPLAHAFPNVLAIADSPGVVTALLVAACGLSLLLTVGWFDRVAAVLLWYLLACLFGRNPLIANPSLPYVGLCLLAHALQRPAPFGSVVALGRVDPRGGWRADGGIFTALWLALAAGYSYSGWTKLVSPSWRDGTAFERVLENPLARTGWLNELLLALPDGVLKLATWGAIGLELAFLPLAFSRRARPWIWSALLAMHVGLILLIDFADLSFGMLVVHLFTFDPAWVPGRRVPELVFYDGSCGLCHRSVRLALAEDPEPAALAFGPLDGETFAAAVPEERRRDLPDSFVILSDDGELLTRSDGTVRILTALGGLWGVLGRLLAAVPRSIRNAGYDLVARYRKRLFAAPSEACPMIPPDLGSRFRP